MRSKAGERERENQSDNNRFLMGWCMYVICLHPSDFVVGESYNFEYTVFKQVKTFRQHL